MKFNLNFEWIRFFNELTHSLILTWILLFIICMSLYLTFWKTNLFSDRKIPQPINSPQSNIWREGIRTFLNIIVYLLPVATYILARDIGGHDFRYEKVSDRGWVYFFFSILIMIFVYDTYFFWIHFAFHRIQFKPHFVHHKVINPNPWSAFSFHPMETFLVSLPYYFFLLFLPWHENAIFIFVLISLFINSFLHLGYDPFPTTWQTKPWFRFLFTPVHHGLHHQQPTYNFGLFFTFWDYALRTKLDLNRLNRFENQ